ncbi:MAG: CdaR family protein [Candidatus Aminicenantes bacterium]|nr:CdaR family protein [Candidatus Aminicenantes bacterium]
MKRWLKNLLVRNWELKIFSLILAFILWITLVPEEKTFSIKTIPASLETYNLPSEFEIVEKPPATVDVTIKAPNRIIGQITSNNVFVKLNLEKASLLQEEYPINPSMVSLPAGAEVVSISPNKVRIKLEKSQEVTLEVSPTLVGVLNQRYQLTKIEVFPTQVIVRGPESRVKAKDKVRTSPIDISLLTQPTEFEADLILPRAELRLASSITKARVRIYVQEKETDLPAPKKK